MMLNIKHTLAVLTVLVALATPSLTTGPRVDIQPTNPVVQNECSGSACPD